MRGLTRLLTLPLFRVAPLLRLLLVGLGVIGGLGILFLLRLLQLVLLRLLAGRFLLRRLFSPFLDAHAVLLRLRWCV